MVMPFLSPGPCPQVELPKQEVLRYLGHPAGHSLELELQQGFERALETIKLAARPRMVAKPFRISRAQNGEIALEGGLALPGEDIRLHLAHADTCVLLAATLGREAERQIDLMARKRMWESVMMDAAATALIESVCNKAEEMLREQALAGGMDLTDRFSCGYGDLPLELQPDLLRLLDTGRGIGLNCTETLILTPRKSVTAIMGVIPSGFARSSRGCQSCRLRESCRFRKEGAVCGREPE